jgi:REP element-mobilizing transposase RayT
MEIRNRVGHPRAFFHVMNRGARGLSIFAGDEDRALFLRLLSKFALKYEVDIVAWCLMPNHYHLAPDTEGTRLSEMMHDLDGTYAKFFNQKHELKGCLFQGPFKSMLIQDVDGLAYVSRYIHLNPSRDPERAASYPWSSCRSYLGLAPIPAWLKPWSVLDHCREGGKSVVESYSSYLATSLRRSRPSPASGEEPGAFYLEWMRYLEERIADGLLRSRSLFGRVSLQTVVAWVARRISGISPAAVAEYCGYKDEESVRAVTGRFHMRLQENPLLLRTLETVIADATRQR